MSLFSTLRNAVAQGALDSQQARRNIARGIGEQLLSKVDFPVPGFVRQIREGLDNLKNPLLDTKSQVMGGMNLREYREVFDGDVIKAYQRKCLYRVSIYDQNMPPTAAPPDPPFKVTDPDVILIFRDNLRALAIDVSYSRALTGEKVQIGGLMQDSTTAREPVEIQITFLDTAVSIVKRWADGKLEQAVKPNGLFGLPVEYVIGIVIEEFNPLDFKVVSKNKFIAKVSNVNNEHTNRETGLKEVQVTFSEMDEFMQ